MNSKTANLNRTQTTDGKDDSKPSEMAADTLADAESIMIEHARKTENVIAPYVRDNVWNWS